VSEQASASTAPSDGWETIIGLEVHVELGTATKMFCGCANQFGSEPNTNICPVCLGLPGSLPVVNERAVELACALGLALGCEVRPSVFARKNYFYPDMPKDYQVTQYDQPTNSDGELVLPSGTRIGITRAHLEEDTGKSTHVGESGRIHGADHSLIDYNRAGVPLLEIVSEPDIRSSEEAREYVSELRAVILAVGASDAKMEEGSMRVDANVSVHPPGTPFGTRCEIKNVNSLRSLGRAIDYEVRRQIEAIGAGESIVQETRHWDEEAGRTRPGRRKEDADDYRYFQEPDLVPLDPEDAWLDGLRRSLPVLPAARRSALAAAAGVAPTSEAVALLVQRDQDALALAAIDIGADPGRVLTHVEHDVPADASTAFDPAALAGVVRLEGDHKLTATQAKKVLEVIAERGGAADPAAVAAELGFEAMAAGDLEALVDEAIAANADAWAKILGGNDKAAGAITGYVMKATKGQADGKAIAEILAARKSSAG
jgi:aspartyl-tRNA(Asn)/glutamyl-tRNA(Gln) amidotransferase subunit B